MNIDIGWLIGVLGIAAAYFGISASRRNKKRADEAEKRVETINTAQEVRNDTQSKSDDDVLAVAAKWLRNKDKR